MDKKNEILLLLTDRWCDWEASYAIAVANTFSDYVVKTIALDTNPKASMGNLCANIDYSIDDYLNFSNTAIIILPGGLSWEENNYDKIDNSNCIEVNGKAFTKCLSQFGEIGDSQGREQGVETILYVWCVNAGYLAQHTENPGSQNAVQNRALHAVGV